MFGMSEAVRVYLQHGASESRTLRAWQSQILAVT